MYRGKPYDFDHRMLPMLLVPLLLAGVSAETIGPVTIDIGSSPSSALSFVDLGWTDGVCYRPITNVRPDDTLKFEYSGHDVYQMASRDHLDNCDFTDATKLAGFGDSPFEYVVTESDAQQSDGDGGMYFACSIGAHCTSGLQRLIVQIEKPLATERIEDRDQFLPTSEYVVGVSEVDCSLYQIGGDLNDAEFLASTCSEATLGDNGRYSVSCLSGPATLTPGGTINSYRAMHYPYPTDHRVVIEEELWEFVSGDPIEGTIEGVTTVPLNQLYVHHVGGNIVLAQGAEGARQSDAGATYPFPYGKLTGEESENMSFHIFDLRGVDEWLQCVECRCRNPESGTFLNTGGGDGQTGGINCCTNCTSTIDPLQTVDYRMRYNVTYSEIPEDETITDVQMLTIDICPIVGKDIECDVPSFEYVKPENQKDGYIQRLTRTGVFRDLFKMEFFDATYAGPDTVRLLRCIGHLHVAAIGIYLEDANTGETICKGEGTYGTNPAQDKGFLTSIDVESFNPPLEFSADRQVTLVTEYNATELHTGVMGMYVLFISSENQITKNEASLSVDICRDDACDVSLLPVAPPTVVSTCSDLIMSSPMCKYGGLCSCEDFVNNPESTGCGGVFSSDMGDVQVNSMCAKHCGACSKTCEDDLPNGPLCSFGNLCSCEELVNHPNSTGCGGVYPTDFGDTQVNSVCAAYCDVCPDTDTSDTDVIQKQILKILEEKLSELCRYATVDCQRMLTNLYSCASHSILMTNELDVNVVAVVKKHGESLALAHAELGNLALRRNAEKSRNVLPCTLPTVSPSDVPSKSPAGNAQSESSTGNAESSRFGVGIGIGILIGAVAVALAFLIVLKVRKANALSRYTAEEEEIDQTRLYKSSV